MLVFAELVRPRIVVMELFALAMAAWTAAAAPPPWGALLAALAGTGLIICGAIALNQLLERHSDAQMERTRARPLPSGRLSPRAVLAFGLAVSLLGALLLAALSTAAVLVAAAASWFIYVCIYTPLKKVTPWQMPIGAAAGAMPALIGAAAADAPWSLVGWALFAVIFFWQFPHTMAIGWLYREDYRRAGLQTASVADPSGRFSGVLAVGGAAVLWGVSFLPLAALANEGAGRAAIVLYAAAAVLLGGGYLYYSIRFARQTDEAGARRLLRVSLLHLPLLLAALLAAKLL